MPFTQVKGTVTTGITKDNLHPERTQDQVILFVVIFFHMTTGRSYTFFFVFCFCWGTQKVQATLLAIPAFVAIAKKHVQNGNHAGHYCQGCPPTSANFSLETTPTHTHRDRAGEEASLEGKLRKPVTKEIRKVSSWNAISQYAKQLDRRRHTYLRCANDKAEWMFENKCLVCWAKHFFDDASHATALRFASIPKNPPQGPCSRQLLLHGCTHNCAHMFSYMHPVDIPKMKLPIYTVNVPNDIGVWII